MSFQLKKNTSIVDHDVNIDQNTMNQLLGNMDNLTTTVQGLKENYQKVSIFKLIALRRAKTLWSILHRVLAILRAIGLIQTYSLAFVQILTTFNGMELQFLKRT